MLDAHLWLSLGGVFLGLYLCEKLGVKAQLQIGLSWLIYFWVSYSLHAYVSFFKGDCSLNEVKEGIYSLAYKLSMMLCLLVCLIGGWVDVGNVLWMILAGLTPFYSYWRSVGEKGVLAQFKPVITTTVLMIIYSLELGLDWLEYKESYLMMAHIFINVLCGDLRDIDSDLVAKRPSWMARLGYEKSRQVLLLSMGLLCLLSLLWGCWEWGVTMTLGMAILARLTKKSGADAYHLLDLMHFMPWLLGQCFK